jgi:hypothetical protein
MNEIPPDSGQNHGSRKPATPSKLTVEQYLKRVPQDMGIGELVRSLYRTKIMSFGEWETTVRSLLQKPVR